MKTARKVLSIIVLATLLLSCFETGARAQEANKEFKYDLRLSYGGCPTIGLIVGRVNSRHPWYFDYPKSIADIYKNNQGAIYTSGSAGLDFSMKIKKWFSLSMGIYVEHLWSNGTDIFTGEPSGKIAEGNFVHMIPTARFSYINRKHFTMYSSVGLGWAFCLTDNNTEFFVTPVLQTAPVGIMFGGRVYGMAELCLGLECLGGRIGMGVRF